MKVLPKVLIPFILLVSLLSSADEVRVGSKNFTEGYILGELLAQTLETFPDLQVQRRFGLGGTGVLFQALSSDEIQVYPEYTGTIAEAILKNPNLKTHDEIQEALRKIGLEMSGSLGFNNTYALAVKKSFAQKNNLQTMSDLEPIANKVRMGFSHEFMNREDGFPSLRTHYHYPLGSNIISLEHSLAYPAISSGKVDVIDVYSTDAKLRKLGLQILRDDRKIFPTYEAVWLARKDFVEKHPNEWKSLRALENSIDAPAMTLLNAAIDLERKTPAQAVRDHLGIDVANESSSEKLGFRVWRRTKEHVALVGISLLFAILLGIPFGVLASRSSFAGQTLLLLSGVIQTIPSLALLCFMIPFFGIGIRPALVALCLYGLLPVVLNTYVGLRSIEPRLLETCQALGLRPWRQLTWIELPLASRSILAGIKTSAIIGIGTATLAALIGAGGYGAPIVTGLAMNDMSMILTGAVPAAVMALVVHFIFELASRFLIPKGLR